MINTAKVAGRRELHFETLDDIAADVERLASARELKTLGNWTSGQIFDHVARIMHKSIDGFDGKMNPVLRWLFNKLFKNYFISHKMSAGFKLSTKQGEEFIASSISHEEGLANLRLALGRLKSETKRVSSPFLGDMTLEEWTKLHCRHSELHLSFLVPVD